MDMIKKPISVINLLALNELNRFTLCAAFSELLNRCRDYQFGD